MTIRFTAPKRHDGLHKKIFAALLAVGVFTAFLLIPASGAFAQKVATLENIKGTVQVMKEGKKRGRKGRDGMALFSKQIVKTGGGSMADVRFAKGGVVRLTANTELALSQVSYDKGSFKVGIDLAAGKIFNVVNKLSGGSSYTVSTTTGTSGVKGTVYSAEINGQTTVFMVKEGKVEAANPDEPDETVLVTDLKKTTIGAGETPSEPIPLTPAEIAMFDILDDVRAQLKGDMKEEIRESVQEQLIAPDLGDFRP